MEQKNQHMEIISSTNATLWQQFTFQQIMKTMIWRNSVDIHSQFRKHYKHNFNYFLIRPRAISHLASQHTWWQRVVAWLVIKLQRLRYWAKMASGERVIALTKSRVYTLICFPFLFFETISLLFISENWNYSTNIIQFIASRCITAVACYVLSFPGTSHTFKTLPTTLLIPFIWLSLRYFAFLIIHMNLM